MDLIVDVARSVQRASSCVGAIPCLLPNSQMYRVFTGQTLTPLEVMACQGLFTEDFPILAMWAAEPKHAALLRDMAGNSFASSVCLAVVIAVLAG